MNVTDLKKRLSVEIMPVYFLKGHDAYLVEWAIKVLCSLVDADYADFNVSTFEDAENMKDILTSLNTVPMFSDRRVIVVKSAVNLDEGDKSRLETYLRNPADSAVLVIVDDLVADSNSDKVYSPLYSLYNYGEVVDCGKVDVAQFCDWISSYVQRKGCTISPQAVRTLSGYTTCNMARAVKEADKLCTFAEGKEISASMVEELVAADNEYKIYALSNALTDGRNEEALKILQSFLDKGEKPSVLLGLIEEQYRKMLQVKISPLDTPELAKAMGKSQGLIAVNRRLAAGYSAVALKNTVDKIVGLEYAFKSGSMDDLQSLHEVFSYLLKKK